MRNMIFLMIIAIFEISATYGKHLHRYRKNKPLDSIIKPSYLILDDVSLKIVNNDVMVSKNMKNKRDFAGSRRVNGEEEEKQAEEALLNINETNIHGKHEGDHVFHGDMMFNLGEEKNIFENVVENKKKHNKIVPSSHATDSKYHRGSIINPAMKWNTLVPFIIHPQLEDAGSIAMAMDEIEQKSCIRFIERQNNQKDYLKFAANKGCWSYVGKRGGEQDISISTGCTYKATVLHEILHALGFYHEQEREDRDFFIDILWDNIIGGLGSNFEKKIKTNRFGTPYDYFSVMHYPRTAFGVKTRSGYQANTIQPKLCTQNNRNHPSCVTKDKKLGQPPHGGLSILDAHELNNMYCVLSSQKLIPILDFFLNKYVGATNHDLVKHVLNYIDNLYRNTYYIYVIVLHGINILPSEVSYTGYCVVRTLYRTLLVCYTWKRFRDERHLAWRNQVWKHINQNILLNSKCDLKQIRNKSWFVMKSYVKRTGGSSMVVIVDRDSVAYTQGWSFNTPIKYREDISCLSGEKNKEISLMALF